MPQGERPSGANRHSRSGKTQGFRRLLGKIHGAQTEEYGRRAIKRFFSRDQNLTVIRIILALERRGMHKGAFFSHIVKLAGLKRPRAVYSIFHALYGRAINQGHEYTQMLQREIRDYAERLRHEFSISKGEQRKRLRQEDSSIIRGYKQFEKWRRSRLGTEKLSVTLFFRGKAATRNENALLLLAALERKGELAHCDIPTVRKITGITSTGRWIAIKSLISSRSLLAPNSVSLSPLLQREILKYVDKLIEELQRNPDLQRAAEDLVRRYEPELRRAKQRQRRSRRLKRLNIG